MGLFSSSDGRGFLVAGFLLVATASSALAAEDFLITASFAPADTFALGEFAALVEKCSGADFTNAATSTDLKVQCVKGLISASAMCSTVTSTTGSKLMCTVNDVQIDTSLISFTCDETNGCPSADSTISAELSGLTCPAPASNPDGFVGSCYSSAH